MRLRRHHVTKIFDKKLKNTPLQQKHFETSKSCV